MSKKIALITGITGQDGSYLAELLIEKGYEVHGIIRRSSDFNTRRIDHIFDPDSKLFIHFGDLAQGFSELIYSIKPDEIYNIGSMSHVRVSFDVPVYTGDITGIGVCRILEALRRGIEQDILKPTTKFYQASSSEMFGQTPPLENGYNENSLFTPVSPYGCAKLYGYHITRTYRKGFNIFASNGILFNHESPRRGATFVTRKITRAVSRIKLGVQKRLVLGNLNALRDWGHSKDYMRAIHLIMQQEAPGDYVVATGEQYTVKEFLIACFDYYGMNWEDYVDYDKVYERPNEVPNLLGDSSKIRALGWKPEYDFKALVKDMCDSDFIIEKKEAGL